MAKQSVSIVERHLEKAVLGVCVVVLLAAVALYLVSSPNTIEMGNDTVSPGIIDAKIAEAGRNLAARLRNVAVDKIEIEDAVPKLMEAVNPLEYARLPRTLPRSVPFLPPVPKVVEPTPQAGEIVLAKVVMPSKPMVTQGRSTLSLVPHAILGQPGITPPGPNEINPYKRDVNWVTVAATYDIQRQIDVCKKAGYKPGRRNPYVIGVDLQRRAKLTDGSYSDWADVKSYAPLVAPDPPEVKVVKGIKEQVLEPETRERIEEFRALIEQGQLELYRPLFPLSEYGDEWGYPRFADIDVRALDAELNPDNDRVYPGEVHDGAGPEQPKKPEELLAEARKFLRVHKWKEAKALAQEVLDMPPVAGPIREDAKQLIELANQTALDIRRGRKKDPYVKGGEADVEQRPKSRYQVAWAHDAAVSGENGAQSGRVYQYRMRLRAYNRFCGYPAELKDPKDAEKVLLASDWSEPTDDVYIPPDTRFFLTSGNVIDRKGAKVSVFKWYEGVWVNHAFAIKVGSKIGDKARERIRPGDRPEIDFDTDATVVDIDYDYLYRPKKEKARRRFTVQSARKTVALVYADSGGHLHQRILAADKGSAEYKSYKEMVRRTTGP